MTESNGFKRRINIPFSIGTWHFSGTQASSTCSEVYPKLSNLISQTWCIINVVFFKCYCVLPFGKQIGCHLLVHGKIVEVHVAGYIVVYPSGIPAYAIFTFGQMNCGALKTSQKENICSTENCIFGTLLFKECIGTVVHIQIQYKGHQSWHTTRPRLA